MPKTQDKKQNQVPRIASDIQSRTEKYFDTLLTTTLTNTSASSAPTIIAVGCSGGADSMALTHMLNGWALKNNKHIHALIVDHNIRPEANAEAQITKTALATYERVTPFILKWADGAGIKTAIQERARDARYALMAQHCTAHNITHLCTAHHMDDQFETVLFRLAGGSGLDGLGGIKATSKHTKTLTLVRPLLEVSKNDLTGYCAAHNIAHVNDPSNQNDRFARVRLRGAAAALSAEGLTPKRLSTTAMRLSRARDALDAYAEQAFNTHLITQDETAKNKHQITLHKNILQACPTEIIIRVLLHSINLLTPRSKTSPPPRLSRVESIAADLLNTNTPMRGRTLGGIKFSRDDKRGLIVIQKL